MYKKVDTKLDFAGREPEVVKFWKDNDLIKKMIEKNKNGEDYTKELLELLKKQEDKRVHMFVNGEKIFDYVSSLILTISAKK